MKNNKTVLREFASDESHPVGDIVASLSALMGKMARVGGNKRLYKLPNGQTAMVYAVINAGCGVGLGWRKSPSEVNTVYYWPVLDMSKSPSYSIDLPTGGDMERMAPVIVSMLKAQVLGENSF